MLGHTGEGGHLEPALLLRGPRNFGANPVRPGTQASMGVPAHVCTGPGRVWHLRKQVGVRWWELCPIGAVALLLGSQGGVRGAVAG